MMFSFRSQIILHLVAILASIPPSTHGTHDHAETFRSGQLSVLLLNGLFPGHLFPLVSLGEELVRRGHNVTLCSTVMEGSKLLPGIPESAGVTFLSAGYDAISQDEYSMLMKNLNRFSAVKRITYSGQESSLKIRDKIKSIGVENFDIIICDYSVIHVGLLYAVLGNRVIIFSSFLPPYPAVQPSWPIPIPSLTGGQSENLTFLQRLSNSIMSVFLGPLIDSVFESIRDVDTEFAEVLNGIKFLRFPGVYVPHIITTVVDFDIPTLLTPLRHYVGPVLKGTISDLNENIESWLGDRQDKSVLYISMGSTGCISKNTAKAIVEGVKGTKYDAIWALRKDSEDLLEGLDLDNRFLIQNWVDQQVVLKHRTITASIIHCGLNSVQESIYNGLPVICLPHAFDQFQTSTTIQFMQVGVSMYTLLDTFIGNREFSTEDINKAIEIVTSEDYRTNARRLSKLYKFAGGATTAANLVEFYADVGYDHLIPAFAKYNWTWVQYYNADVYAVFTILFAGILYVLYKCIFCCCSTCTIFRRSSEKNKNE